MRPPFKLVPVQQTGYAQPEPIYNRRKYSVSRRLWLWRLPSQLRAGSAYPSPVLQGFNTGYSPYAGQWLPNRGAATSHRPFNTFYATVNNGAYGGGYGGNMQAFSSYHNNHQASPYTTVQLPTHRRASLAIAATTVPGFWAAIENQV
ncbi:MAG: hypothetical protein R2857_04405 [Vampirovibrionales bacterium]